MKTVFDEALSSFLLDRGGHPQGAVYTHDQSKTVFLLIPKCGLQTMRTLEAYGFVGGGFLRKPDDWFSFTIWRSPYDRFISGLCEYARDPRHGSMDRRQGALELFVQETLTEMERTMDIPLLDAHTFPQYLFLTPRVPIDRFVRFENFAEVETLLRNRGVDFALSKYNESLPETKAVVTELVAPYRSLIEQIYWVDQRLWEAA